MPRAIQSESVEARIILSIKKLFTPLKKISVVGWAENELYLSPRFTERSGMFSTADMAYMREPLECFKDYDVREVDLMFSTQTGKTTLEQVGLAYSIACNARRAMWAFPTDDVARKFVKKRWNILVSDAQVLSSHKTDNADDMTNFDQSFDTCNVMFTGVGSAAKVSSEPIALLIEDEIDKFPKASDTESDARSLLEERTKSFIYKLIVRSSTPTTRYGNIYKSFEKSDQRYYYVRCPHCGKQFKFEFKGLRWYSRDEDKAEEWDIMKVRESARYYCPECEHAITDTQRRKMIKGGTWISENPNAIGNHRGYHLNCFYAPTLSLADIAQKWIESKDDPEELQNFVNSWLAEIWEDEAHDNDPTALDACKAEYDRGDKMGVLRVMTIDVQHHNLRFNVRGYDKSGSYLIDWGVAQTFDDCDKLYEKYEVSYVGVDINYRERQSEVFDALFDRKARGWYAIVGAPDNTQSAPFTLSKMDPFSGRKRRLKLSSRSIPLITLRSSYYKGEVARLRSGTRLNWHVYRFVERGYVRELYAEILAEKKERGKTKKYWKRLRDDNHQFDLECYQLALADVLNLRAHGAIKLSPKLQKEDKETPKEDELKTQISTRSEDIKGSSSKKTKKSFSLKNRNGRRFVKSTS